MSKLPLEISELIFQNLSDVVFYIAVEDNDFRFLYVNPAFSKITGLSQSQIEGKLVKDVIPPESHKLVFDNYNTAIREKKTVHWHEVSKYPNGTKYGNVTIVPIGPGGECPALLGTVHDVTGIIEAEQNLKNTMDRISDGIVSMDSNFNYTYVNKVAGELFNKDPEELIGKNYWEEYPEAKGTRFANSYIEALKTQKFIKFDDYYPPWNRWFENRIFPSENGITIFFSDITDRIEKEHELEEARTAATEANAVKSNFLDIAAHELRNPATTIYLMLHAFLIKLQNGGTIDKARLSNILIPVERLNRLVNDLLDSSRLQKNLVRLQKREVEICTLVKGWIDELKLKFNANEISFDCDGPANVFLDDVRIYQVFSNLIDNAIKYSPSGSPIMVKINSTLENINVSVTDRGEGIEKEAITHIFDPFDRCGKDIRQRYKGLGLGLAISKKIIDLHGGTIGVDSEIQKGSTFYFELPRSL